MQPTHAQSADAASPASVHTAHRGSSAFASFGFGKTVGGVGSGMGGVGASMRKMARVPPLTCLLPVGAVTKLGRGPGRQAPPQGRDL